jgi:hypothetical protein
MIIFERVWEENGQVRRQTIDPRDFYEAEPIPYAWSADRYRTDAILDLRRRPDGVWEIAQE